MSNSKLSKLEKRKRRQKRVRAQIFGTKECPRLTASRTLRNMYVQVIDDEAGKTLVGLHSKTTKLSGDAGERKGNVAIAYLLGKDIAEKTKAIGVDTVVFDRAGNKYHGRMQALAEGAREGGLQF